MLDQETGASGGRRRRRGGGGGSESRRSERTSADRGVASPEPSPSPH